MYDLPALEAALQGTIFAGKVRYLGITGSTNGDAMEAARNGAPEGFVCLADEQTAGRGRGGHGWSSASGEGLYASVLLRPEISASRLGLLPLVAGLAAAEAIRAATGLNADLRWPNDLLIGERKAGGILAEAHAEASGAVFAVVGVGINVHQREFLPGLSTPATSLDLAAGARVSRSALLVALLKSLERERRGLEAPEVAALISSRIEKASSWVRGRSVEVHGPQACRGVTEGLDESGFLRVRTDSGVVQVRTGGIRAAETE
jgi:BirA family transcriptional regulator, biotin operon repressor / biotin---[acetyl-CoA-carboxylase] ligase